MPIGLLNLALGVAMQVGTPGPSEAPGYPAPPNAYGRYGSEGSSEQRYPFDTQQNFVHGYFQELPAYGGHHLFRPYNYKDVLSQSQTAAGWGERPTMPYSQQFWHKYHDQATMLKSASAAPPRGTPVWTSAAATRPAPAYAGWNAAPGSQLILPPGYSITPGYTPVPGYAPAAGPAAVPGYSTGPLHSPGPAFAPVSYPELQPGPGVQPAVEVINPVSYRR